MEGKELKSGTEREDEEKLNGVDKERDQQETQRHFEKLNYPFEDQIERLFIQVLAPTIHKVMLSSYVGLQFPEFL